jgi:hypothetical protein
MDLDEKESWPRLLTLDQLSLVELPGIEPPLYQCFYCLTCRSSKV